MRGDTKTSILDPLAGQPTDEHGIPLSIVHGPQTDLPVWQFIHKLASPVPNPRNGDRPYTHICILCSAVPPLRPSGKKMFTWTNALMRQRMSTNAVAHMQRVHPDQFVTIANYKLNKRNALVGKARAGATGGQDEKYPLKKLKRIAAASTKNNNTIHTGETLEMNEKIVPETQQLCPSKHESGQRARHLVEKWLLSSGSPLSIHCDETLHQLWKHAVPTAITLPTAVDFSHYLQEEFAHFTTHYLQEEFAHFTTFVKSYLAAESKAAMGKAFLNLCQEFRPIEDPTDAQEDTSGGPSNQQKAFFSVAIGFLDSQWRRVDLVLVTKIVQLETNQPETHLVTQSVFETYNLPSIVNHARFQSVIHDPLRLNLAAWEETTRSRDEDEDLLTSRLRHCVVEALGIRPGCSFHAETSLCRIFHLLEKLVQYFEVPDRAHALAALNATDCTPRSIESAPLSTSTSIGAILNLLKAVCMRFPSYWSYFHSPTRPTATMPELETAWTQLTMQDWHTVAEVEAILNHLSQFHLDERRVLPAGTVASSFAMLFRRLLSVTINSLSFKCYALDEATTTSECSKISVRRKAKSIDSFTSSGRHFLVQLRQLIPLKFPSPSSTSAIDDEIKAMLLDPRISAKAADLVTDTQAFRRATEALRQEHRLVFELLAATPGAACPIVEEEVEEEDDDEEFRALLMVDGPQNQLSSASCSTNTRKTSALASNEASAWRDWQQVYVAWDTHASNGADLFVKGQYNLLKLYHHVNILEWFRDVGQAKYPAASFLARIYLGHQPPSPQALGASLLRFTAQEKAEWMAQAAERAEKRCLLHHNWQYYQQLSTDAARSSTDDVV
ncbi:hypothetical protein PsorP6_002866 [Peronosclerospora sorghi]|uniref:Uncharacterized protein n=1 Tax=Peronosclerospora sorghi TaxID=230839 RepID=A0ACC0VPM7_9STRA|nr:hypothetical protein PsorP6_002866 [Peronosclerospora sorghi]